MLSLVTPPCYLNNDQRTVQELITCGGIPLPHLAFKNSSQNPPGNSGVIGHPEINAALSFNTARCW